LAAAFQIPITGGNLSGNLARIYLVLNFAELASGRTLILASDLWNLGVQIYCRALSAELTIELKGSDFKGGE